MTTRGFRSRADLYAQRFVGGRRSVSNAVHFYSNRQLELYAAKEAHRLSLRQLVSTEYERHFACDSFMMIQVFFGRSMNEERIIKV